MVAPTRMGSGAVSSVGVGVAVGDTVGAGVSVEVGVAVLVAVGDTTLGVGLEGVGSPKAGMATRMGDVGVATARVRVGVGAGVTVIRVVGWVSDAAGVTMKSGVPAGVSGIVSVGVATRVGPATGSACPRGTTDVGAGTKVGVGARPGTRVAPPKSIVGVGDGVLSGASVGVTSGVPGGWSVGIETVTVPSPPTGAGVGVGAAPLQATTKAKSSANGIPRLLINTLRTPRRRETHPEMTDP